MKEAVHLAIEKLADDSPIKKHLTDMEAQVVFNCLTEFNAELHDKSMRDDGRLEGLEKGREEGREEGRAEGLMEAAQRMLEIGKLSIEEVAEYSGLSVEEVQKLAAGK